MNEINEETLEHNEDYLLLDKDRFNLKSKASNGIVEYKNFNSIYLSQLYLPKQYHFLPEYFDIETAPNSDYINNTKNEMKCIENLINFQRQYRLLFQDRKPILLFPNNEYGTPKIICTFIKPFKLKFSEIDDWLSASKFVSDFLNFVPLAPVTEIPNRILSITKTIEIQRGTCFEYSIFLCSLLISLGYDSYVVVGYANRKLCFMDQTRELFANLPDVSNELPNLPQHETVLKYQVNPLRLFQSKHELLTEAQTIQNRLDRHRDELNKELEIEQKLNKQPDDDLVGLRVHCWILVKHGRRNVGNDFFIEPTIGCKMSIKSDLYEGIESIFNHENCWINLFDCSNGIDDMMYDLDDRNWEIVLPETTRCFIPSSWVKKPLIPHYIYEKRYPDFVKVIYYYKTKCEFYSPYFMDNGLDIKMTLFSDVNYERIEEIQETYRNRLDKLHKIIIKNDWTIIMYSNTDNHSTYNVLEHHFLTENKYISNRLLLFNSKQRSDCLYKRKETEITLEEWYENRNDNLVHLFCVYDTPERFCDSNRSRLISKIVKTYSRNELVPYYDDVESLIFYLDEQRIFINYHKDPSAIINDTREFLKIGIKEESGKLKVPFYTDSHLNFTVTKRDKKSQVELYQLYRKCLSDEECTIKRLREIENETLAIIKYYEDLRIDDQLELCLFDTIRNVETRERRLELEYYDSECELNKYREEELDYLAPHLAKSDLVVITTKEEAYRVREECLDSFQKKLVRVGHAIKLKYEKEVEKLLPGHENNCKWLQSRSENEAGIIKDNEKVIKTRLSYLEALMRQHKVSAPLKYFQMEETLRNDKRLKPFIDPLMISGGMGEHSKFFNL